MPDTTKFKILSTLGPKSLTAEFISTAAETGQCHFRLNASHMSLRDIAEYHSFVRNILKNEPADFTLDLPGNKLRIGEFRNSILLRQGEEIILFEGETSNDKTIPIPVDGFIDQIEIGDQLVLQDGTIELAVREKEFERLTASVLTGGILRTRAGLMVRNRPMSSFASRRDFKSQIELCRRLGIENIALSYVFQANEICELRKYCQSIHYKTHIIAKIEYEPVLKEVGAVIQEADGVWYCRGDMGTFLGAFELADLQEKIIELSTEKRRPAFIAGQVFHHLTFHAQPTRSEIIHFAQLIRNGVSGIVLSDETAIGTDPVNALQQVNHLLG